MIFNLLAIPNTKNKHSLQNMGIRCPEYSESNFSWHKRAYKKIENLLSNNQNTYINTLCQLSGHVMYVSKHKMKNDDKRLL
jgi:hypothetical protein